MTKCLTIGLSSYAAAVRRYVAEDASDGVYQDHTIDHDGDWYDKETRTQPFEDNYIPGAPKEGRAWM